MSANSISSLQFSVGKRNYATESGTKIITGNPPQINAIEQGEKIKLDPIAAKFLNIIAGRDNDASTLMPVDLKGLTKEKLNEELQKYGLSLQEATVSNNDKTTKEIVTLIDKNSIFAPVTDGKRTVKIGVLFDSE